MSSIQESYNARVVTCSLSEEALVEIQDISTTIIPKPQGRSSNGYGDNHIGDVISCDDGFTIYHSKRDGLCFLDNMKKYVELTQKFGAPLHFYIMVSRCVIGEDPKPYNHLAIVMVKERCDNGEMLGEYAKYIDVSNGRSEIWKLGSKISAWRKSAKKMEWALMDMDDDFIDIFKIKRSKVDYDKLCYRAGTVCYCNWLRDIGYSGK